MHRKLASAIANSGLLVAVLLLLTGPLLLGQLLSTHQSGALGAITAKTGGSGTLVAATDFAVTPNATDFQQYAQFGPDQQRDAKTFQTSVTFTAFGGQLAAYNGLLSVANLTRQPLRLVAQVGTLSGALINAKAWLTLVPAGSVGSSLVTGDAVVGATQLEVAGVEGFTSGKVVAGAVVADAVKQGLNQIGLVQPLAQKVAAGDKIYFGPAYFAGAAKPVLDTTAPMILLPGQKGVVNLTVALDNSATAQSQAVLPIVITEQ